MFSLVDDDRTSARRTRSWRERCSSAEVARHDRARGPAKEGGEGRTIARQPAPHAGRGRDGSRSETGCRVVSIDLNPPRSRALLAFARADHPALQAVLRVDRENKAIWLAAPRGTLLSGPASRRAARRSPRVCLGAAARDGRGARRDRRRARAVDDAGMVTLAFTSARTDRDRRPLDRLALAPPTCPFAAVWRMSVWPRSSALARFFPVGLLLLAACRRRRQQVSRCVSGVASRRRASPTPAKPVVVEEIKRTSAVRHRPQPQLHFLQRVAFDDNAVMVNRKFRLPCSAASTRTGSSISTRRCDHEVNGIVPEQPDDADRAFRSLATATALKVRITEAQQQTARSVPMIDWGGPALRGPSRTRPRCRRAPHR